MNSLGSSFAVGKIMLIVLASILLSFAVYKNRASMADTPQPQPTETRGPDESTPTPSDTDVPAKTQNQDLNFTPKPEPEETQLPVNNTGFSISGLIYPGSNIQNSSPASATLTSIDNFDSIKNWYKNTLDGVDFNARSFVSTNTNGDNLVKASYAKSGLTVNLEIKNNSGDPITTITIDLDS